ncbi:MAG: WYL domain-containing protein [Nitrospirae bacterium]|nr:WYL domain-containing protein [Nitrospirota bacterium]
MSTGVVTRPPLERFWIIHRSLRAGRTEDGERPSCTSLARLLEVSTKTVQRDIDFMRDRLKAPIEYHRESKSWRYMRDDYAFALNSLSEEDLFALIYGCQVLQKIGVGALGDELLALARETNPSNPSGESSLVSFSDEPGVILDPGILRPVIQGLLRRRRLDITYFTIYREAVTRRQVDPYHLGRYMGRWFLIGYDHFRKGRRVFAVAQIKQVRVLRQTFTVPPEFNPRKYIGEDGFSFERLSGPVKVELAFERQAGLVARELIWHKTQRFEEGADGRIHLIFETKNLQQVLRWVLARGADVEVVTPAELRREAYKVLSKAAGFYAGDNNNGVKS